MRTLELKLPFERGWDGEAKGAMESKACVELPCIKDIDIEDG